MYLRLEASQILLSHGTGAQAEIGGPDDNVGKAGQAWACPNLFALTGSDIGDAASQACLQLPRATKNYQELPRPMCG